MIIARSKAILGFNGIRGICVTLVYLSHKVSLRLYAAQMGVWTFFALSGFLIVGELHRQRLDIEADTYGVTSGLRTFFTKRAVRIFPAYYGLLVVLFVFRDFYAWAGPDLGFRYHFVYLSNVWFGYWAPALGGPFGVLWTLSVEQQFYVVAPFALLLTPSRYHVRICLVTAVLAAGGHVWMQAVGVNAMAIYMTSPWNIAIIALGGAAGMTVKDPRFAQALRGPVPLSLCLSVVAMYAASLAFYRTDNAEQAVPLFCITLALVGLVTWVSINQESTLVRGLEWRPLAHLGVISYGFYLIHNFVPNPLGKVLPLYLGVSVSPLMTSTLGAAVGFAVSYSLAHLSWTYYERPLLMLRSGSVRPASRPSLAAREPASSARR